MSSTWTIEAGDDTWVHEPGDNGPFENLQITHNSIGVSILQFRYTAQEAMTDADIIAHGTVVTLKKDDTVWFVGKVISTPKLAGPDSETQTVKVANAIHDLTRCTYNQTWSVYSGGTKGPAEKSRVILGGGTTSGSQIAAVLNYAISKGVSLQIGTIDAGLTLPADERTNMSCWDVITTLLRYLPNHVAWIDYTTSPPTFHCRNVTNLTPVQKALTDGDLLDLTARNDLPVSGIKITYEITSTVGNRSVTAIATDTAGDTDALDTVYANFDLQGSQKSYIEARIETDNIPSTGDTNSAAMKDYVQKRFPALAALRDEDFQITAATRTGTMPYVIEKGPVPSWVGDTETDEQEFKIDYAIREDPSDGNSDIVEIVRDEIFRANLKTTNENTGTYRKLSSYTSGESIPLNVADELFAAWSILHYQGSFTYTDEEVDGQTRPGRTFGFTAAADPMDGTTALIQQTTENIDTGTTTVNFGPPGRLDANTLVGLFRALRSHRTSFSKSYQDDADAGEEESASDISGATPEAPASQSSAKRRRLQLINENETDELTHKITLDPAEVEFASDQYNTDAGEPTAKVLKPTEAFILVTNGTGLAAKRVQMLATDPYGDPITILPAGLTQGDLLVFGSDQLERLAIGSDKHVLTSDGTTSGWDAVPEELPSGGSTNDYLKKTATGTAWQSPTEGCA